MIQATDTMTQTGITLSQARILVIAEHDNLNLHPGCARVIAGANSLAKLMDTSVHLLVAGAGCEGVVAQVRQLDGVGQVLWADTEELRYPLAETFAPWIASLMQDYEMLLMAATTWGKDLLPRVGALLDVQPITDVVQIVDASTFKRPIYAGSALETLVSHQPLKLLSLRTSAFANAGRAQEDADVRPVAVTLGKTSTRYLDAQATNSGPEGSRRQELTSARVVVSGGRGLQAAEHFSLLYQLADKLHAAVGASRAAVDAGFVGNDLQVGQTGKVVAPELYLAIGLSGAVQHQAGMRDSRIIVAINKDPDAPIFQIADYGLVADLFEVLPELIEQL